MKRRQKAVSRWPIIRHLRYAFWFAWYQEQACRDDRPWTVFGQIGFADQKRLDEIYNGER